jgi:IS5 family transposase
MEHGGGQMQQQTFTDIEYAKRKRKTKRDEFLKIMDDIIPWEEWVALVEPIYYKNKVGRPARGIEIMLRMFLLQSWFNLSDEGVEDAVYDSYAFRVFMNLDFVDEQAPDATTLCKFRKLLVDNGMAGQFFEAINRCLEEHGHIMRGGTVVDATIIEAPASTKNRERKRDPEMHQTKKGNEWHFGMKVHVGVDAGTGYVHSVVVTSANESDVAQTVHLLREDDEVVYGDSGYTGVEKRPEIAGDFAKAAIDFRINCRPGNVRNLPEGFAKDFAKALEHRKSSVRAKVEHVFQFIKQRFGFAKAVYRGLRKNLHRIQILLCSVNLLMCAKSGGWRTS